MLFLYFLILPFFLGADDDIPDQFSEQTPTVGPKDESEYKYYKYKPPSDEPVTAPPLPSDSSNPFSDPLRNVPFSDNDKQQSVDFMKQLNDELANDSDLHPELKKKEDPPEVKKPVEFKIKEEEKIIEDQEEQIPSQEDLMKKMDIMKKQKQFDDQKKLLFYKEKQIISIFKYPQLFQNIPIRLQRKVKSFEKHHKIDVLALPFFDYQKQISDYTSLTSKTFVDHFGKQGRSGEAVIIDDSLKGKKVKAVLNYKVFAFFQKDQIYHVLRTSVLKLKDILASPCMNLYYPKNEQFSIMICFDTQQEKFLWILVKQQIQDLIKIQPNCQLT